MSLPLWDWSVSSKCKHLVTKQYKPEPSTSRIVFFNKGQFLKQQSNKQTIPAYSKSLAIKQTCSKFGREARGRVAIWWGNWRVGGLGGVGGGSGEFSVIVVRVVVIGGQQECGERVL